MVRQESHHKKLSADARETIQEHTKELATRHGLLPQRVQRVLERAMANSVYGFYYLTRFSNPLEEAISFVDPHKALQIFENEDLKVLTRRMSLIESLKDKYQPFYTLEELSDVTEAFLHHLERNREHLFETGLPRTYFAASPWLDAYLSRLYPVKCPLLHPELVHTFDIFRFDPDRDRNKYLPSTVIENDEEGDWVYKYVWTKEPPLDELDRDEIARFIRKGDRSSPSITSSALRWKNGKVYADLMQRRPLTLCNYDEAPYILGLSRRDIAGMQEMRSRVFDIKMRVLERLLQATRMRDATNLWNECLKIVTDPDSLLSKEAEFLLTIDRYLARFPSGGRLGCALSTGGYLDAGLNELLAIIGHYEKELTIGTMTRTRERLNELPFELCSSSYYDLIEQPWRDDLDHALDQYYVLNRRERRFWKEYGHRVNDALQNEFYEESVTRQKVKTKFAAKFEVTIRYASETTAAYIEATGHVPQVSLLQPEATRPSEEKRDGRTLARFPTPERTCWEDVTITFISEHDVNIEAKGVSGEYNFSQLGLGDGRKKDEVPCELWRLLQDFAAHPEGISWGTSLNARIGRKSLATTVCKLGKKLKTVLRIDDAPFHDYRKFKAYRPKFVVRDIS